MNRYWNVIAGLVILHVAICGLGWLLGRIDFELYLKAVMPVILPTIGYFMAFLPKAGQ